MATCQGTCQTVRIPDTLWSVLWLICAFGGGEGEREKMDRESEKCLPKIPFDRLGRCSEEEFGSFESICRSWNSKRRFCSEKLNRFKLKQIFIPLY